MSTPRHRTHRSTEPRLPATDPATRTTTMLLLTPAVSSQEITDAGVLPMVITGQTRSLASGQDLTRKTNSRHPCQPALEGDKTLHTACERTKTHIMKAIRAHWLSIHALSHLGSSLMAILTRRHPSAAEKDPLLFSKTRCTKYRPSAKVHVKDSNRTWSLNLHHTAR